MPDGTTQDRVSKTGSVRWEEATDSSARSNGHGRMASVIPNSSRSSCSAHQNNAPMHRRVALFKLTAAINGLFSCL
jgi:hypothetical protein